MSKRKVIILSIIFVLLVLCVFISISYGYYVIASNEQVEMPTATTTPSCIGLTISKRDAFKLDADYAVPITDEQFLNSGEDTKNKFKYSFTITSDCAESKSLNIGVAALNGSDLEMTKLKYVLVESGASSNITKDSIKSFSSEQSKTLPEEIKKYLKETVGKEGVSLYNISSVSLDNQTTKSYDLYIWVSSDAGNEYMDKTFSAAIVLDNATS